MLTKANSHQKKSKKEREYYQKGNALADNYIDFLDASLGIDQEVINEAVKKLYHGICPKEEIGKVGHADKTIKTIDEINNANIRGL